MSVGAAPLLPSHFQSNTSRKRSVTSPYRDTTNVQPLANDFDFPTPLSPRVVRSPSRRAASSSSSSSHSHSHSNHSHSHSNNANHGSHGSHPTAHSKPASSPLQAYSPLQSSLSSAQSSPSYFQSPSPTTPSSTTSHIQRSRSEATLRGIHEVAAGADGLILAGSSASHSSDPNHSTTKTNGHETKSSGNGSGASHAVHKQVASLSPTRTNGGFSSTDGEMETASEGRSSAWSEHRKSNGHRKSSSMGSRIEQLAMLRPAPVFSSLQAAGSREEILRDSHDEGSTHSREDIHSPQPFKLSAPPRSRLRTSSALTAKQDGFAVQDTPRSDQDHAGFAHSQTLLDTEAEDWGANFWVVISDPKTDHSFFYNPSTGDCRWTVEAGTIVLPRNPNGDWMEFFDESQNLPYYYHTLTRQTQWDRPKGLVIPLTALQNLKARSSKRSSVASSAWSTNSSAVPFRRGGLRSPISDTSPSQATRSRAGSDNTHQRQSSFTRQDLMAQALGQAAQTLHNQTPRRGQLVRHGSAQDMNELSGNRPTERPPLPFARPSLPTSHSSTHLPTSPQYQQPARNSIFPRDDSGLSLLSEIGPSPRKPAHRGRFDSQTTEHRLPFSSRLNSITEQSISSPSNSPKSTAEKPMQGKTIAHLARIATVGSLLTIPKPPSSSVATRAGNGRLSNATPPASPHKSIDMMTLSSHSEVGPFRRPRDPEKRRNGFVNATPPRSRWVVTEQATFAEDVIAEDEVPAGPSTGASPASAMPLSVYRFQDFARLQLSSRRRGIFSKRETPLESLLWHRNQNTGPLLSLDKELHRDAVHCFKIIFRLCGERSKPVFFPKPPPVPIGYSPLAAEQGSCYEGSATVYRKPARHRHKCLSPSNMDEDGPTIWEEQRWLLEICISKAPLRDEVFCQLVTRLNKSAPPVSRFRAWQFFGVLLSSIAPSQRDLIDALQVFIDDACHPDLEHESIRALARHCKKRLIAILKRGTDTKAPTVQEIQGAWEAAFNPSVFGQSLDAIMEAQAESYPGMAVPIILPFLVDALFLFDATRTAGIFRLSGDVEKQVELRVRIDRGHYSLNGLCGRNDVLAIASVLKLFLRELEEPLIPTAMYHECIRAAARDNTNHCIRVVAQFPAIHRRVVLYLVAVLQRFCRPEVVKSTGVDARALSTIFSPNFFRCPSTDLSTVSTNARFEAHFLHILFMHLPCEAVDPAYVPNVDFDLTSTRRERQQQQLLQQQQQRLSQFREQERERELGRRRQWEREHGSTPAHGPLGGSLQQGEAALRPRLAQVNGASSSGPFQRLPVQQQPLPPPPASRSYLPTSPQHLKFSHRATSDDLSPLSEGSIGEDVLRGSDTVGLL